MQSVAEIKSSLHNYISSTHDLQKLATIKKYVQDLLRDEEKIIGYTKEGKPINEKTFTAMVQKSIESVKQGKYVTQEDLEKDDSWLKEK